MLCQGSDGGLLGFESLGETGEGGLGGVSSGSGDAGPIEELYFLRVGSWEGESTEALLGLVC